MPTLCAPFVCSPRRLFAVLGVAAPALMSAGWGWGCATDPTWARHPTRVRSTDEQHRAHQQLASYMIGAFSSEQQADNDPDYRHISLIMAPAWATRKGCWLYVEQAMADTPTKPYRQRMYRLTALPIEPGQPLAWRSDVFALPGDGQRFVGAWKDPERLDSIREEDLIPRTGCSVWIYQVAREEFIGSTRGTGCASDLHGATHATSDVRIRIDGIDAWDRGYDAAGEQVWGPTKGPYRFRRTRSE